MSSRQTLSGMQRTNAYAPNGQVARHVYDETWNITSREQIIPIKGIYPEFWVRSGVGYNRYYHVICDERGQWYCSASDGRIAGIKITLAQAYLMSHARQQEEGVNA